jgi:hypothetical protein
VNAVGRRFRLANDPDSWTEVIGVVRDTGTGSFTNDVLDPIAPPFYSSYTQVRRAGVGKYLDGDITIEPGVARHNVQPGFSRVTKSTNARRASR